MPQPLPALFPACISAHPLGMFWGHIPGVTGHMCRWKGIPPQSTLCEPVLGVRWETEKVGDTVPALRHVIISPGR